MPARPARPACHGPLVLAFALVLGLMLLAASLVSHGPAWLLGGALSALGQQTPRLEAAQGLWYRGSGRLALAGVSESLPLSWQLSWQLKWQPSQPLDGRGLELILNLQEGIRGEIRCGPRLECASAGLDGRLPGTWLAPLAPALGSVGVQGQIAWHLDRLHWTPEGGASLALNWRSGALYAARLDLPLGWYAGTLQGPWGAGRDALSLQLESAPPAGMEPPFQVRAQGQVGPRGLDMAGQIRLPPEADPRLGRVLEMLGLARSGGPFRYRSGA